MRMGWLVVPAVMSLSMMVSVAAAQRQPARGADSDSPAASAGGASSLRDQLVQNEKSLAAAQSNKQARTLDQMLDPNLIFVAFNGLVFTRQQLVSKIQYIDVSQYDMENFKVRPFGDAAALLTYDLRVKASVAGHNLPDKEYASSVWVRHGRGWQLVFHQETPAHHS